MHPYTWMNFIQCFLYPSTVVHLRSESDPPSIPKANVRSQNSTLVLIAYRVIKWRISTFRSSDGLLASILSTREHVHSGFNRTLQTWITPRVFRILEREGRLILTCSSWCECLFECTCTCDSDLPLELVASCSLKALWVFAPAGTP